MSRGAADKLPRKMLHGFAASSGGLAFTGVILMSVAVMNLDQDNEVSGVWGLDADFIDCLNDATLKDTQLLA